MSEQIKIPLLDDDSNVTITIVNEPKQQKLIMLHCNYFSEQFGLDTTGVHLELHKDIMILRMTSTNSEVHQSLYLDPEKCNELELFFKEAGFPMPRLRALDEPPNN